MLGRVSLFKNTCFKVKFKNITFLVLICVKVGESSLYSEGLTPTTCFIKKELGLGAIPANVANSNYGVICEVKMEI